MKLDKDFYTGNDVVAIAKSLLGKRLCTNIHGICTSGMITEVEAYCGRNDKACHANDNKRTKRTEIMYAEGGKAYIYLCYGIHHLFNVVTNTVDNADAVLIRSLEPMDGREEMTKRRKLKTKKLNFTRGPGVLTQALGITTKLNGEDLLGERIWIEETIYRLENTEIESAKRVGVDYAGDHALRPWRFYIKGNPWVSKV